MGIIEFNKQDLRDNMPGHGPGLPGTGCDCNEPHLPIRSMNMSLIGDDYGEIGKGSVIYTSPLHPVAIALMGFAAGAMTTLAFIWKVFA